MIAIIGAMQIEVDEILKLCEDVEEKVISSRKFYLAKLSGKEIVICLSGVGLVAASMSTTILLEHFNLDLIINIGTAGGIKDNQEVLDIVLSNGVVQHDFDTSAVDGESGFGLYFGCNQELVDKALICLTPFGRVHCGVVASGDQFVAHDDLIHRIKKQFPDVICAEMEAAAIAQVAHNYKMNLIVIRSLSDVALKNDSHLDFLEYAKVASARSAQFCKKMVESL